MQTKQPERRAYRVNEFCAAFRVSRAHTYKLIAQGRLKIVKLGGRTLIPADAAEALLARGTGSIDTRATSAAQHSDAVPE
jgi:excisionase family DNA binding protein